MLVTASGDPLEDLRLRPGIQQSVIDAARARARPRQAVHPALLGLARRSFVQGDFGKNLKGQEVRPQLTRALGLTLRLVLVSSILAMILGLAVGVISAVRQYSAFDYSSTFISFLFFAMPVFWFAVLLKEFGAIKLNGWISNWGFKIYTIGSESTPLPHSFFNRLWDYAGHTILPVITLAIISYAGYSRFTRASMLETMDSDYVRTAQGQGPVEQAGHPASTPSGRRSSRSSRSSPSTSARVLGGAFITETVFPGTAWAPCSATPLLPYLDPNPAMAYLMITAAHGRDLQHAGRHRLRLPRSEDPP